LDKRISIGLLNIIAEAGERRAFLPGFVAGLEKYGAQVFLEDGYGSGMGYTEDDYRKVAPQVVITTRQEVYQQDYVLVIRYPGDDEIIRYRPPGYLVSMLHYPTRPQRVDFLRSLGVRGISLDSIKDDTGRRLVENLRSVAWNGTEAAFRTLRIIYPSPGFDSPHRPPINTLLIGAGAVGSHVVQAAIRYGNLALWNEMIERGAPGVQVTVVDFDTTRLPARMLELLKSADLVVDATQRPDPGKPVIPNEWLGNLPPHAVLLDLSVDPYDCGNPPSVVKGIEGIPQGDLDQYIFSPDDPAFDKIPACISTHNRRYSVSCYSWPGVYPRECMEVYGHQLGPIMRTILEKGGVENFSPRGRYFERAITRALLENWNA
jgi:alanine dehydrogenase